MSLSGLGVTWLGHGTFLLKTPRGQHVVIDPWLQSNPACPDNRKKIAAADLVLVTHGHFDHIEDAVSVARATGATVVANFEICQWLGQRGVQKTSPMNKGGTQTVAGVRITMVDAQHSSSYIDGSNIIYLGEPSGFVLGFDNGLTAYFAGDTGLFGDMRLIGEFYKPAIAFLPIGDLFTMGSDAAAKAAELLGVRQIVPMHFGTFPALTGTPAELRKLVEPKGIQVLELKPGETAQ